MKQTGRKKTKLVMENKTEHIKVPTLHGSISNFVIIDFQFNAINPCNLGNSHINNQPVTPSNLKQYYHRNTPLVGQIAQSKSNCKIIIQ